MQNLNKHIINKVFLEINTNSKEKGYYLKDHIDAFLQKEIFSFLENYFNEIASKKPSHSIQLDKLDIDIAINQNLDFENIKDQILKKVTKQVEEVFEKEDKNTEGYKLINAQEKEIGSFFHFLETGTNIWWTTLNQDFKIVDDNAFNEILNDETFSLKWKNAVQKPIVRTRFIKQFSDSQIVTIIKKGILLKQNNVESSAKIIRIETIKKYIEMSISKNQLIANQRFLIWEMVVLILLETSNAIVKQKLSKLICSVFEFHKKQIFLEHKKLFLSEIQNQITNQNELELLANLDAVVSIIENKIQQSIILKEKETKTQTVSKIQESVKTETETKSKTKPETEIKTKTKGKTETEKGTENKTEIKTERIQKNNEKEVSSSDLVSLKNKDIQTENDTENNESVSNNSIEKTLNTQEKVLDKKDFSIEKEEKENTEEVILDIEENVTDANIYIDTNVNDLYVQNAGLVLIHPFMKFLFENCKLLNKDDNTINNPEVAAHLLHYIATGQEQDYENTMAFEKFLCNIPIAQPIERNIVLSEEMKKEATAMLQAVLSNWDIMKTSSAELLQNEFLQRPGKLNVNGDESPVILIERKTQDILLDKLSWNLSIVKLAWKKRIIYVNW
ncbi:contractile injection system tape measure protein [Flavobacterium sp. RS13.1]|uniref:contractile injection system tape measure protein n=1 Tax=Flavobacterium sp. RS13.1 TaxID=3400345 RepID=UPI003AAB36AA